MLSRLFCVIFIRSFHLGVSSAWAETKQFDGQGLADPKDTSLVEISGSFATCIA